VASATQLEFEKPIVELERQIDEIKKTAGDSQLSVAEAIEPLERKLEDLREELVTIIHDHLARLSSVPRVEFGETFHFQQSHVVQVPLGATARTLAEFRAGLAGVEASAIYYHMVEARARLGRPTGDFAEWLRGSLGMSELAEGIGRIDTYMTSLERVRARVLSLIDEELERP